MQFAALILGRDVQLPALTSVRHERLQTRVDVHVLLERLVLKPQQNHQDKTIMIKPWFYDPQKQIQLKTHVLLEQLTLKSTE